MYINIPEYGTLDIDEALFIKDGEWYSKNMNECLKYNFVQTSIDKMEAYICCFENRAGLYSFLSNYTFIGSYFYDFEELYCPGLDFYCWAIDECGDIYLEDVSWLDSVLSVLMDEKNIYQIENEDKRIYIICNIDKLVSNHDNEELVARIDMAMSKCFEKCFNDLIDELDDCLNYEFSEWGNNIIKMINQ